MERERSGLVEQPRCPYCHEEVRPAEPQWGCGACRAWHHRDCRDEVGKCAACGAVEGTAEVPAQEAERLRRAYGALHLGITVVVAVLMAALGGLLARAAGGGEAVVLVALGGALGVLLMHLAGRRLVGDALQRRVAADQAKALEALGATTPIREDLPAAATLIGLSIAGVALGVALGGRAHLPEGVVLGGIGGSLAGALLAYLLGRRRARGAKE